LKIEEQFPKKQTTKNNKKINIPSGRFQNIILYFVFMKKGISMMFVTSIGQQQTT